MSEEKKRVPGDWLVRRARTRSIVLLVLAGLVVIGGAIVSALMFREMDQTGMFAGTGMALLGSFVFVAVWLIRGDWRRAFDELEYEWSAQAHDAKILGAACRVELYPKRDFLHSFRPNQAHVDKVIQDAAISVDAYAKAVLRLYAHGMLGRDADISGGDTGKEVIHLKEAFTQERDRLECELGQAVQRFGHLHDLAKGQGYTVMACWPDYLPRKDEAADFPPDGVHG